MLRKATKLEIEYYEQSLYPLQDKVLELVDTDKFYLSGGTCLSRYYYQHRYSNDLDFFFNGYNYSESEFHDVFNKIFANLKNSLRIEKALDDEYFKRVIVKKDEVTLKLEFIHEYYKHIGEFKKVGNFYIDSRENVAANKITTVYNRKAERDFFDLYFLLNDVSLDDVIKFSETKIVPLDYEGVMIALHGVSFIDEDVLMIKEISKQSFNKFVQDLQMKLVKHAKKIS